ncbi:hypothetical protein BC829DRAFT_227411 [Chytridium lagenaria]|nr:hypothetical protein BC829DRAFT_227411 [Chytridium lagenaria]
MTKKEPRPPRIRTPADNFVIAFLVSAAIYWSATAYLSNHYNILQEWGVTPESSVFSLKKNFKEYMMKRFTGWTELGDRSSMTDPALIAQADSLEKWFASLKSQESRRLYVFYGHQVFTSCTWASEPWDLVYCLVPSIILNYAVMAIVLGVGTISESKRPWRLYGTIALTLCVFAEIYFFSTYEEEMNLPDGLYNFGESSNMYRRIAFAVLWCRHCRV